MADDDQAWINANPDPDWFFSPQAGFSQSSPFAALFVIIRLFSEQAVLKFTQVAKINFSKAERGADSKAPTDADEPNQSVLNNAPKLQ